MPLVSVVKVGILNGCSEAVPELGGLYTGVTVEYLASLARAENNLFSLVHYYSLIAQQATSLSVALRDICLGCKLMQKI